MKSHLDIARYLRQHMKAQGVTQSLLVEQAKVSPRTLTLLLKGTSDYRVSTLLGVADRLGLELVLVPKDAAAAVQAGHGPTEPVVRTRVQAALDQLPGSDKTKDVSQ